MGNIISYTGNKVFSLNSHHYIGFVHIPVVSGATKKKKIYTTTNFANYDEK